MSRLAGRLPAAGLLLALGVVGVYLASRAGTQAAVAALIALGCAMALLLRTEPGSVESLSLSRVFDGALLALPGALIVYFSFDSGGYFPASPALVAIVLVL